MVNVTFVTHKENMIPSIPQAHAENPSGNMAGGLLLDASKLSVDFTDYIENVRNLAPPTVRSYRYVLNQFVGFLEGVDLQTLTLKDIDDYIAQFSSQRHLRASSVNTTRCILRAFFLYIDRYRGIRLNFDYSMIRQVKAPRSPISFTSLEQIKEIIRHLESPQDKLMVLTMFCTGMRIGELVRFRAEDFHGSEITVRGKGGVNRVVPIDDELSAALHAYLRVHLITVGPVFRHQQHKHSHPNGAYTVSGVRKRWERLLTPYGLYVKPHSLRHGIATSLLMQGMDIRTLQTFLGHTHIATTMLYTHVTDTHLKESYQSNFKKLNIHVSQYVN